MLDRQMLWKALHEKHSQFQIFEEDNAEQHRLYSSALESLAAQTKRELDSALTDFDWPGARPTEEYGPLAMELPARLDWMSYEGAVEWAKEILRGVTTYAIDGSQIWVERDVSVPVGVVQAGWFENPHDRERLYCKQVNLEVVPPDEIEAYSESIPGANKTAAARQLIGQRRFQMEAEHLIGYVESQAGSRQKPICFFDNPLIASYVDRARPEQQRAYIDPICRLLEASERCQVPVIGYVDNSYALDLVTMLACLNGWERPDGIRDATILWPYLDWCDRTPAYVSAREGVLSSYKDPTTGDWYGEKIAFVYLQPSQHSRDEGPPARLEFPRWLLDSGQLEHVLDVVRAECIVGRGFPYGLEVADGVAVLTAKDWEYFYTTLQQFLHKEGVRLRLSRKRRSKRGRR